MFFLLTIPLLGLRPRTLALLSVAFAALGPVLLFATDGMNLPDSGTSEPTPITLATEPLALLVQILVTGGYPAVVYIRDHLQQEITMKEMADLCHLSPSYFSRTFNRETGESFVNYINRRKVALAKELLRETNKSITQIAEEAGYINISNFIAVFKRMEGVTPSVYRQHMYK